MKIVIDSCSAILLAKVSVIEALLNTYQIMMTKQVYKEIIKGKDKMFQDALLIEKLSKEKKINQIEPNLKLMKKLTQDFNMGKGEASTIATGIKENIIIATDNKQGRKATNINNLPLVGSIELIVSLFKKNKINHEKAVKALKILKEEGWFNQYLIEKAMEDLK